MDSDGGAARRSGWDEQVAERGGTLLFTWPEAFPLHLAIVLRGEACYRAPKTHGNRTPGCRPSILRVRLRATGRSSRLALG
jgi:hypothetical protein